MGLGGGAEGRTLKSGDPVYIYIICVLPVVLLFLILVYKSLNNCVNTKKLVQKVFE